MTVGSTINLLKTEHLSDEQSRQVEILISECRLADGLDLDLYLEPSSPLTADRTNQILAQENAELVGIVTLFDGDGLEVQGMVHPRCRRKGIGTALLNAARDEAKKRGATHLLLVCDTASRSGAEFALSLGAGEAYSEYVLQFDPAAAAPPDPKPAPLEEQIHLRRVGDDEAETLVRLSAADHEEPEEAVRSRMMTWLAEPNQRLYTGVRSDGTAVGMLRVAAFDENLYINTFSVLSPLRGRGYGRQMLTEIVRLLAPEGKPVRLEVETQNKNALSLYLSCGFVEIIAYRYYALPV
ncbi:MAG: GNAT family N-acetyltransferase [Armatimonadota bacterium]